MHNKQDLTFLLSVVFVVLMALFMLLVQHFTTIWVLKYSILIYFGFYCFLFILPLFPGTLEGLANDPEKRPDNPYFGFLTFIQQGRVHVIQRGKTFFRAIMDYAAHMWFGERKNALVPRQPDYWEVEPSGEVKETADGEEHIEHYADSNPIPFPVKSWGDAKARWWWLLYAPLSINWWVWKRYMYSVYGAVFTGFYWWQAPLIHRMRYKKISTDKDGNIHLEPADSYSNHFRVSEFVFHVIVPNADTKDQAQVRIVVTYVLRVFNPHMAAYRTDGDLGGRIDAAATASITEYTRAHTLEQVQAAENEQEAKRITDYLKLIGDRSIPSAPLCSFGVECFSVQIRDISPSTQGLADSLAAFSVAKNQRKADEELAIGQAAYIARAKEAAAGDPNAVPLARARADVEMVQAGAQGKPGNLIVINSGRGDSDPAQLALLQAIQNLSGEIRNDGPTRRGGSGRSNPPTITSDGTADPE